MSRTELYNFLIFNLEGFRRVGKKGDDYVAKCPCHEDDRPSLSITFAEDRVLLFCHAGCPTEKILQALGLEWSQIFYRPERKAKEYVQAVYNYCDEEGRLLYQVVRYNPKNFRMRRPNGNGGWIWNIDESRRVLYNLPEVLKAVEEGRWVFICEGEKDCNSLAALGLTATTNPGGAMKWPMDLEFSKALQGARVVILPDNDSVGREHAKKVARILTGVAKEIKILELPGLPDKGDVTDWLDAGGTKEELLQMAEEAPLWQPPDPPGVRPELKFKRPWISPRGDEIRVYVTATLPPAIMPGGKLLAKDNLQLTNPQSIEEFISKVASRYEDVVPEAKRVEEGPIDRDWIREQIYDKSKHLLALIRDPRANAEGEDPLAGTPYAVREGCLCFRKWTENGEIYLPLSNFIAQVVRDVAHDDGAEVSHVFEIEGTLASGEALPRIAVPEDRFSSMNWVLRWGIRPVISAGQGNKDRLREAIQLLSKAAIRETVYTHLGWRKLSGKWVFLHAGGAVGGDGVLVEPEAENLRGYALPTNGSPEAGMKASLQVLDIGPPEITYPLWAAVWRAPTACLLYPSLVLWLYGKTGSFKSTLAALFISHFGGPFTKDSLTASWLATDNALERLIFLARDVLFVIDDYAPEKHPREAAELDKRVNRLVRQIGNRAARTRLTGDLKARPDTPPNALVIATGEQLPLGITSVAARILPVFCERDKIDLSKLSQAQAEAHLLAQAMRGYLEWLAPQMEQLAKLLPRRFEELRVKATVDGHARLPEAVAHLYLGAELGTAYAVKLGVLTEDEAREIKDRCWKVLLTLACEHARTLEEERPVVKFIQVLDAIFTQRKAHLLDRVSGGRPLLAQLFGWQLTGEDDEAAYPGGELLGWVDKDGLYLMPEAAFRAVSEYLRPTEGLPIRERTLRDLLVQEGIAEPGEGGRSTRQVRCQGSLKRVLHLWLNSYLSLLQKAGTVGTEPASLTAPTDSPFPPSGNTAGTTARETGTPPDGCSHFEGQCSHMFPEGGNVERLESQRVKLSVPDVPACKGEEKIEEGEDLREVLI